MRTLVLTSADGRGSIRQADAPSGAPAWAAVDECFNPLAPAQDPPPLIPGGRLVLWSGWTQPAPGADDTPEPAPAWLRSSHTAFEAWCDRTAPALANAEATVLFRPHARHVLSDAPSCISFLRRRGGGGEEAGSGFGLLFDPCAMLDATMLRRADDHLPRILDALVGLPSVGAILLTNLQPAPGAPGGLRPAPLHRGILPPALIVAAFRNHAPAIPALVLLDTQLDQQKAVLDAP